MTHLPHPYLPEMAVQFIAQMATGWARRSAAVFGIHLRNLSEEPLIGVTGLHCDAMERAVAEGGYWLGLEYHGKGYATEAFAALSHWGFQSFELRRISAYTFAGNTASERVLQKVGFAHEGIARQARTQMGVCYDVNAWGMLKSSCTA
jgi:ribosomal-protein-alanine N-acetyltransferase